MNVTALLLADSRFPGGGHVHSGGLEEAASRGLVRTEADLPAFLRNRLRTAGALTAAFAAAAARPGVDWLVLDAELDARTPSAAQRAASRAQGRATARAAQAMLSVRQAERGPVVRESHSLAQGPPGFHATGGDRHFRAAPGGGLGADGRGSDGRGCDGRGFDGLGDVGAGDGFDGRGVGGLGGLAAAGGVDGCQVGGSAGDGGVGGGGGAVEAVGDGAGGRGFGELTAHGGVDGCQVGGSAGDGGVGGGGGAVEAVGDGAGGRGFGELTAHGEVDGCQPGLSAGDGGVGGCGDPGAGVGGRGVGGLAGDGGVDRCQVGVSAAAAGVGASGGAVPGADCPAGRRVVVSGGGSAVDGRQVAVAGLLAAVPRPHHAILLGALIGVPEDAALTAAYLSVSGPASASVRLLGLDPLRVNAIVAAFAAEITDVAVTAAEACSPADLPAPGAPGLDVLAEEHDRHHREEVRLFAS